MSAAVPRATVARLLAGTAAPTDGAAEDRRVRERQLARMAWSLNRIDALKRANEALFAAWDKLIEPYADWDEENIPDIPDPPEQAEVERILGEINDVIDHDRWPAHLHFKAV
jgi:hypothetical protein